LNNFVQMTYSLRFFCFVTVLYFIVPAAVLGQQRSFDFDPDISYEESIPSPEEFLGYKLGDAYTLHSDVVAYFKALDEASDRITLQKYGETYEGRGLYYVAITSGENQSNIEQLKENNLQLAGGDQDSDGNSDSEVDAESQAGGDNMSGDRIENQPVIVWLSYNVHGNEASSSEAAMQSAYRLVAATDTETQRLRDEAITIIDPMLNPDGRDRYVFWYKSSRSNVLNTNAEDLEHDEIWPGGRTNHYWFDLNRDWTWLVHPESRGRIAAYQQWMPQVHLDLHEQGFNDNYFTMPGTTPRNYELPDDYEKWADVFGRGAIAEFDKHNINYATRESFDFFYPGYGSSYPSVMGAIGMLAEQGGHSRGGRAVETDDGYVLTLRQRIFDHYTNSISTVRTAVENRQPLLNYFRNSFTQDARKGDVASFVLPDNGSDYTYELVDILLKHGVEIERATEDFSLGDSYSYWDGESDDRSFEEGSFVIDMNQPRHVFLNTLMKRELTIKDSVMYDMSTWSAPLAYNLDAAWSNASPGVQTETLTEAPQYPAGVINSSAQYGYVIDWSQRYAPNALAKLWEAGYRVRSAEKEIVFNDSTYSRGSLVVLVGRNFEKKDQMASDMQRIAEEARVRIQGFDTGRMQSGMDLASESSIPVKKPKVGLMMDRPFSSYTAGQIWFLFDRWTDFGISRIRSGSLPVIDLNEYDVLIMPGARGDFSSAFDSTARARLKDWVESGGTLVATENAAEFMTKKESGMTSVELVKEDTNGNGEASDGGMSNDGASEGANKDGETTGGSDEEIDPAAYTSYAAREDSSGLKRIPGAAFKGMIDNTHPLAFGLSDQLYSLKFSDESLKPSTDWQVVGYYPNEPGEVLASGYASQDNIKKSAGNAFAGVADVGSGKVVFLLDNTQYRMFWVGPTRMMQNAVMLLHDM
jgi:hypothetical protein